METIACSQVQLRPNQKNHR